MSAMCFKEQVTDRHLLGPGGSSRDLTSEATQQGCDRCIRGIRFVSGVKNTLSAKIDANNLLVITIVFEVARARGKGQGARQG